MEGAGEFFRDFSLYLLPSCSVPRSDLLSLNPPLVISLHRAGDFVVRKLWTACVTQENSLPHPPTTPAALVSAKPGRSLALLHTTMADEEEGDGVENIGVFARLKPLTNKGDTRGNVQIKQRFGKAKAVQVCHIRSHRCCPCTPVVLAAPVSRCAAAATMSMITMCIQHFSCRRPRHPCCMLAITVLPSGSARPRLSSPHPFAGTQPRVFARLDLPRHDSTGGDLSDCRTRPRRGGAQWVQLDSGGIRADGIRKDAHHVWARRGALRL